MSTLSFYVCTSSLEFLEHFLTRVMHICHLLAYFTIVSHHFLFAYVIDEGHQSDRNVLPFKKFLISINAAISFLLVTTCRLVAIYLRHLP